MNRLRNQGILYTVGRRASKFYKLLVYLFYVIKNKRIDHISNITSKHHETFTKNFTILFNTRKSENAPKFEFEKF